MTGVAAAVAGIAAAVVLPTAAADPAPTVAPMTGVAGITAAGAAADLAVAIALVTTVAGIAAAVPLPTAAADPAPTAAAAMVAAVWTCVRPF